MSYGTRRIVKERRVRSRRPQAARGSESLGWPTEPGFTRSPDRKERAIGRCVWPRITNGAPAFWTNASSAVHGNTYSSSSRGLPWNMATTPSGIVVRVRSSRSFRYPTFPGVSWIRVHRIAVAASSLKRKVSAPRAARSWFPRIAFIRRSRRICRTSFGHGLYPTRSPATQIPAGATRSTSARTASRAGRFACTSARTARCIPPPIGAVGYMTFSIRGEEEAAIRTTGRHEPGHLRAVILPDRLPMEAEEILRPKPPDPGRPVLRAEETVLHRPGAPRAGDHGGRIALRAFEPDLEGPAERGRGRNRPIRMLPLSKGNTIPFPCKSAAGSA